MVFVPPTWLEGLIIQLVVFLVIPLIFALTVGLILTRKQEWATKFIAVMILFAVGLVIMLPVGAVYWFYNYDVPSVQEKIITVHEWQPKPGIGTDDNGMMTISSANDLLLVTTKREGFLNEENLFFQKFNTRDIFNDLRVNGTYKIKYFGWRNGYNNGFPTILSVEEVVNETGTTENEYNNYFGVKLAIP